MDFVVKRTASLGVPGLVLICAIDLTGLYGAAAITAALAAIGPGGILGGIATLGLIGVIADALAEYGFERLARSVIQELCRRGEDKSSLASKIEKYPISRGMKLKLYDLIADKDTEGGELC